MQQATPTDITPSADSQSLSELVGRLSSDLQTLLRKEGQLAVLEVEQKLDNAKMHVAALGLGIAALAGGALVLLAAAVLAIALVLPAWAAALVVGGALTLAGIVLVAVGKAKLARLSPLPEHTLASVKRDVAAIKRAAT